MSSRYISMPVVIGILIAECFVIELREAKYRMKVTGSAFT